MLDPLTALGLAGNVVQLVQFCAQLLSHAREISSTGGLRETLELRNITVDTTKQVGLVKRSLNSDTPHDTAHTAEDQVGVFGKLRLDLFLN